MKTVTLVTSKISLEKLTYYRTMLAMLGIRLSAVVIK
jgi:hypothetical protein